MAIAFLDGNAIFGTSIEFEGPEVPTRRSMENMYPALNGVESLDMGDAGMVSTIRGRLWGNSPGALAAAVSQIGAFYDGKAHVLTDTDGTSWPNVKLIGFSRLPKKSIDPANGYTQRYEARFFHLTTS